MRILHRSSWATFDCLIREIAVTNVSMADEYSPAAASDTARAIAELLTVLFRAIISSKSTSEICGVTIPWSGKDPGGLLTPPPPTPGPPGPPGPIGPGHGPRGPIWLNWFGC